MEGQGPWAVLSATAFVTVTRVVPISVSTVVLRGALMFAEAPLLAISVSRLCPWLNAGLARVLVCELKREAIDARL